MKNALASLAPPGTQVVDADNGGGGVSDGDDTERHAAMRRQLRQGEYADVVKFRHRPRALPDQKSTVSGKVTSQCPGKPRDFGISSRSSSSFRRVFVRNFHRRIQRTSRDEVSKMENRQYDFSNINARRRRAWSTRKPRKPWVFLASWRSRCRRR